jgi:hypothetical protein
VVRPLGSIRLAERVERFRELNRTAAVQVDSRVENSFSFVRDFERLLGPEFFSRVKSFTRMQTDVAHLEAELIAYADKVQSIVDADTAPAKRATDRRVMETRIADDSEARVRQLDENPGLWIRLHPNVRSLILPNVLL